MAYAAALGLTASFMLLVDGEVLRALGVLVIGTPILVYVASFVFGLISMGLTLLFAAGEPNIFRE